MPHTLAGIRVRVPCSVILVLMTIGPRAVTLAVLVLCVAACSGGGGRQVVPTTSMQTIPWTLARVPSLVGEDYRNVVATIRALGFPPIDDPGPIVKREH